MPRPLRLFLIGLVVILFIGGLIFLFIRFFGGRQTTLTVWTLPGYEEAIKNVGNVYSQSHKGVRIKIVPVSQDEYETKSLFALASSSNSEKHPAPDIWLIPNEWMALHRTKLVAAPDNSLDNALKYKQPRQRGESPPPAPPEGRSNSQIIEQDYAPAVATDAVASNQVWGVPLTMDTLALYYDRSKVSQVPKTWQDVATIAKQTQRSGPTINRSMVALGDNSSVTHFADILSILMLQSGATMVDETTQTAVFNLPKDGGNAPGVQALDFYSSFAQPNRETYAWNATLGQSLDALRAGRTAMAFGYRNDASRFSGNSQIAVAPLPQINTSSPQTYSRYLMATVTKEVTLDPNKDKATLAWDFVSLLANPDVSESVARALNQAPSRIDVAKRVSVGDQLKPFVEQVPNGITWKKKEVAVADAALNEAIELIKKGQNSSNSSDVAAKKYTEFLRLDSGIITDPGVLNVWQSEDDSVDYANIWAGYTSKTVQRVNVTKHDPARYEWEALNAMAAQLGPDIMMVRNDTIQRYQPLLYPLPEAMFTQNKQQGESIVDVVKRIYAPAVAADAVVDNQVYGLPFVMETLGFAYNFDLFESAKEEYEKTISQELTLEEKQELAIVEEPITWNEIKKNAERLVKKQGATITRPYLALGSGANVSNSHDIYALLLKQFGGEVTAPDNRVTGIQLPISSRDRTVPGEQAEKFLKEFSDASKPFYTWNKDMPNSIEALADGKAIAALAYPRDLKVAKERNPQIDLGYLPLPQQLVDRESVNIASYSLMTLPLASRLPTDAVQFLGAQVAASNTITMQDVASPYKSDESNLPQDHRGDDPQFSQVNTAESYFKGQYPQDFNQVLIELMDSKLNLSAAAAKLNQLLNREVLE